jgi:hypothetical protein
LATQVVEMTLPNGTTALGRVAIGEGAGAMKTSGVPKFDFDDVAKTLEGLAQSLKGALADAAPDRVTVELGLELAVKNGKLSGLLVEGEGKGSLGVTLEWAGGEGA